MKCAICNQEVERTFLDKLHGTYVREKGKLKAICSGCQSAGKNP